MDENKVTYFAQTDSRNKRVPFGIKRKDRSRHMYVIGKTGMGKSTLLENMAVQDIQSGEGICFIDPHGKTADLLLEYIPESRKKDVVYFAPFDLEHPIAFNVMEDVGYDKRHLVLSGLMSTFKKIWEDAWSARMEYILGNTILALLEYPGATLLGVNRMFADKEYRRRVVDNVSDPAVKSFWNDEFAKYTEKFAAEATPAIQNKIGQFTANPLIRNIIGQSTSSFDLRKIMDEKKIFIVNLSKGRIGESNANLLGSMLITKIYLAAMSRADLTDSELKKYPNFYLYVDEFQSFANKSFADILSEARKYKLSLTIAHQYIEQMEEEVRAAVFGNVGTMITFRVGAYDADVLEKEFAPKFLAEDLVNLGYIQIYLKLMIDGISSQPFSATTLPPIKMPEKNMKQEVVEASRVLFTRPRSQVEEEIKQWHQPLKPEPKPVAPTPAPLSVARPVVSPTRAASVVAPVVAQALPTKVAIAPQVPAAVPASVSVTAQAPVVASPRVTPSIIPTIARSQAPLHPQSHSHAQPQSHVQSHVQSHQSAPRQSVPQPVAKPISLSQLKSKTTPDTQTGPLKENISALRQALASAMKKDPKDMAEAKSTRPAEAPRVGSATSMPTPTSTSPIATSMPVPTAKKEVRAIQEIPENELRRLLEVEK